MRPTSEIRALLKHAGIRTSAARDESVLADALLAGGLNRDNRPARREPSVWRTIMQSRTTKLVSAAVIVAAIIIILSQFNQPVVRAIELSEMTKAMQQNAWLHMTTTGVSGGVTFSGEQWVGFDSKIHAGKDSRFTVFGSLKDHKWYKYDVNSNTLEIAYMEKFSVDMTSPSLLIERKVKEYEQQGAKIVVRMGTYAGKKVQIQELTFSNSPGRGMTQSLTLYVDPDSKLPYASEDKTYDSTGKVIMGDTSTYDYSQTGPQSIFDLGVPRDARIMDGTSSPGQ
jgi:hypothetical protein